MFMKMLSHKYADVENELLESGYKIIKTERSNNYHLLFHCKDPDGYLIKINADKYKRRGDVNKRFSINGEYTLDNIRHFIDINNINSMLISDSFERDENGQQIKKLWFQCPCGKAFQTDYRYFLSGKKRECNKCTNGGRGIEYKELKKDIESKGFFLCVAEDDFISITQTPLVCKDKDGYKYNVTYSQIMKDVYPDPFNVSNPFTIYNINLFLYKTEKPFECVADKYSGTHKPIDFKCTKCNSVFQRDWAHMYAAERKNSCPICGSIESLHAIVLKQLFLKFHPDTIVEEKSCINPKTGRVMPTDIVNYRLKIAIEVQSQWHDHVDRKDKDLFKKQFWQEKGYTFYDPDIRDYTILQLAQLFFDIDVLPDFINYDYSNKINVKQVQNLLNGGKTVPAIAKELDINPHKIYDAIGAGKIFYPVWYSKNRKSKVVQFDLDWNYINSYESIQSAADTVGTHPSNISSSLLKERFYCHGYNWLREKDYIILLKYLSHLSSETAGLK